MRTPELISPAHYTNWMPFIVVSTTSGLSIASKPTPKRAITATTLFICAVSIGFLFLAYTKSEWKGAVWWVLAIGLLTCVGTPLAIVSHFRAEQRLGPVLSVDFGERTIELPRLGRCFDVADVECFCLLKGALSNDWVSQLQLHTYQGEQFLLVTAYTREELMPILKELLARVPIRVRCFVEDRKTSDRFREEPFEAV